MKCPKCRAENAEGLNFCKSCWTSFREPEDFPYQQAGDSSTDKGDNTKAHGPLFGVPYIDVPRAPHADEPWTANRGAPLSPSSKRSKDSNTFGDQLRMKADAGPSPRSVLSLILGLLSVALFCMLFLTVPIDIAGFVLGMLELREINRGTAPQAGRSYAVAGVVISGLALVIKLFIFLALRV